MKKKGAPLSPSKAFLYFFFPAKALAPPGPAYDEALPPPPDEAKTPLLFPEGPAQAPGPEETATPFPPLLFEKKTALFPLPLLYVEEENEEAEEEEPEKEEEENALVAKSVPHPEAITQPCPSVQKEQTPQESGTPESEQAFEGMETQEEPPQAWQGPQPVKTGPAEAAAEAPPPEEEAAATEFDGPPPPLQRPQPKQPAEKYPL